MFNKIHLSIFFILALSFTFVFGDNVPEQINGHTVITESDDECGIGSYNGTPVVATFSFSICKEDIAYNVLYTVFVDLFNENEILQAFLYGNNDTTFSQKAYSYKLGGPIVALLAAVTQLVFVVGSIILGYSTIKALFLSAQTGDFMGKWHTVWVPLRSLLVIFLIFPMGSLSLIQIFIIILALFAIMLGNYMWGAFLSFVQMETYEISGNTFYEDQMESYSYANTILAASLCQDRTVKAIRYEKFPGSMTTSLKNDFFSIFNNREKERAYLQNVKECIDKELYARYVDYPVSTNRLASISFENKRDCDKNGFEFGNEYAPQFHGEPYSCGSIVFSLPVLDNELSELLNPEGAEANKSFFGQGDLNEIINNFVVNAFDNSSPDQILSGIKSKVSSAMEADNENFNITQEFNEEIEILKNKLSSVATSDILGAISGDINDTSVHKKLLYVGYNLAYASLLGNYNPEGNYFAGGNEVGAKEIIISPLYATYLMGENLLADAYDLNKGVLEEGVFKEVIYQYGEEASKNLQYYNCLKIFPEIAEESKETYELMKRIVNDDKEEGGKKDPRSLSLYLECIDLDMKSNGGDLEVNWTTNGLDNVFSNYKASNHDNFLVVANDKGNEFLKEALSNKMTLAAYSFIVRRAITESYAEVAKEAVDQDLPLKMRRMGFSSAGSYILNVSSEQNNSKSYLGRILNSVRYGSSNYDTNFVNIDSLESFNKVTFKEMNLPGFSDMRAGNSIPEINSNENVEYNTDSEGFAAFMVSVENYITSPLIYLKKMSGLDTNLTLREGIKRCFEDYGSDSAQCGITDIHPLNALTFMGHDIVDSAITLLMIKAVVSGLVYALNKFQGAMAAGTVSAGDTSDGFLKKTGRKILNGLKAVVKGLGLIATLLIGVLYAVDFVLSFLTPFIYTFLIVGIFFAYVLPTVPYIAFMIVFMGWIVLIFELLVAAPIWLLIMSIPDEKGNPRASLSAVWSFFGQLLLKPMVMVLALVFGWFLASLSVFFINITIAGAIAPIVENTLETTIVSLVNVIMFYLTYLVIVYIALNHSFKVINTMPDNIFKWLNIKTMGDDGNISQLQAEQMLKTVLANNIITGALSGPNEKIDELKKNAIRDKKQKESDLQRASEQESIQNMQNKSGINNQSFENNSKPDLKPEQPKVDNNSKKNIDKE